MSELFEGIMGEIAKGPKEGAVAIHKLADRLHEIANVMEAGQAPTILVGGMADRARMKVIGPDGKVKQTVDTGA